MPNENGLTLAPGEKFVGKINGCRFEVVKPEGKDNTMVRDIDTGKKYVCGNAMLKHLLIRGG